MNDLYTPMDQKVGESMLFPLDQVPKKFSFYKLLN